MKIKFDTVYELAGLVDAVRIARQLSKHPSKKAFDRNLAKLLAEKGGYWRLCCTLHRLADFASHVGSMPCEVDAGDDAPS